MGFWRELLFGEPSEVRAAASGVVPPSRSAVSNLVTVETSLGLSGVFRSVQILGTTVGQLDVGVYRRGREIDAPPIVDRPDVDRSRRSFLKRTVTNLAATGNAYWRVYRDPEGKPSVLRSLNPLTMFVGRDGQGRRFFEYHDEWNTETRTLHPVRDRGRSGDVLHLRLLEVPGLELGLGPIQACRATVSGALDLRDYADNWFREAGVPTGTLSTQQQLTKDDADRYRERWHETFETGRDIAVLGAGLAYEPVLLKPADAQFLESRQFSITEQARLFGIPAPLVLAEIDGTAMTYQNMEDIDRTLLKYTVMDYLNVIEDAFTELTPAGVSVGFKTLGFLRGDNKTRAEINETYHRIGVKSAEQIAREEGLPEPPALSASEARERHARFAAAIADTPNRITEGADA